MHDHLHCMHPSSSVHPSILSSIHLSVLEDRQTDSVVLLPQIITRFGLSLSVVVIRSTSTVAIMGCFAFCWRHVRLLVKLLHQGRGCILAVVMVYWLHLQMCLMKINWTHLNFWGNLINKHREKFGNESIQTTIATVAYLSQDTSKGTLQVRYPNDTHQ